MSRFDYETSRKIEAQGYPFYALIMAAIRQADTRNLDLLKSCWPETYREFMQRYNAPGGILPYDPEARRITP